VRREARLDDEDVDMREQRDGDDADPDGRQVAKKRLQIRPRQVDGAAQ